MIHFNDFVKKLFAKNNLVQKTLLGKFKINELKQLVCLVLGREKFQYRITVIDEVSFARLTYVVSTIST